MVKGETISIIILFILVIIVIIMAVVLFIEGEKLKTNVNGLSGTLTDISNLISSSTNNKILLGTSTSGAAAVNEIFYRSTAADSDALPFLSKQLNNTVILPSPDPTNPSNLIFYWIGSDSNVYHYDMPGTQLSPS